MLEIFGGRRRSNFGHRRALGNRRSRLTLTARKSGAKGVEQRLAMAIAAGVAFALVHFSFAAIAQGLGHSEVKQIQLTEKQLQGVVAAQKDVAAVLDKLQGAPPPDQLPPQVLSELDA